PETIAFGGGGAPLSASNTLRGGDAVSGLVGVLTYTWAGDRAGPNAYRLRPLGTLFGSAPRFMTLDERPRPPVVASEPADGGGVRVATMNVLNYFVTLGSRGADDQAELRRQRDKLVAALSGLDADVVGLMELENDPRALADLVAALNRALGEERYAAVEAGRVGGDEIAVGLIYDRATVRLVGGPAILDAGFEPAFRDHHNRAALAQSFETLLGERFTVVVNHLKSKGEPCSDVGDVDQGDLQGNCNGTRVAAIEVMLDWLAGDPTGVSDLEYLLVGDFNAYPLEDPIRRLVEAGYVDLVERFQGPEEYTFVFD